VRVVATVAVAAGVLLTWWLVSERPRTADVHRPLEVSARAEPSPGATAGATPGGAGAASTEVVVDVAGQVRRPGIVTLPAGSRVFEAIEEAGGVKGALEEPTVNLARVLVDGEQILVGLEASAPDAAAPGGSAPPGGGAGGTVNLNSATLEQLDALPGVGPVTAQAILDWRTENGRFASVDDLLDVSGIGDKTLEDLRDRVSV
jgi:competence protein ComEA